MHRAGRIDPEVPRSARPRTAASTALHFPGQPEVIDRLLANYDTVGVELGNRRVDHEVAGVARW